MTKKSKFNWLLDAGHGGMRGNLYTTSPAKMYKFPDGLTIYEGVVNRQITKILYTMLMTAQVDFSLVYDEVEDTSLKKRVDIANRVHAKDPRCFYLAIHSNAGPEAANGLEVFTSLGVTKSDKFAEVFAEQYLIDLPEFKLRIDPSDGDKDKEANFYVNAYTNCPAVLVENLFFTNRKEAEFLLSPVGQVRIAKCLFNAIMKIENDPKY